MASTRVNDDRAPRPAQVSPAPAPAAAAVAAPLGEVRVSVHNGHCHQYGICQQEAPEVFQLRSDTRLHFDTHPPAEQTEQVRQAARLCPMQAISLQQR